MWTRISSKYKVYNFISMKIDLIKTDNQNPTEINRICTQFLKSRFKKGYNIAKNTFQAEIIFDLVWSISNDILVKIKICICEIYSLASFNMHTLSVHYRTLLKINLSNNATNRIMNGPPTRIRSLNQFSQFRWTSGDA